MRENPLDRTGTCSAQKGPGRVGAGSAIPMTASDEMSRDGWITIQQFEEVPVSIC
ncbi:hypothetical protein BDZ89DRAFT_1076508 [Hymenopellis radicata]|nr:hypothetical protein BDZ89DRAFT_1076508 [Hymenopellis radicata]